MLGFGGLPLIWMGDELALRNDYSFATNPDHADDNWWVHRPRMDWEVAARRHEEGTLEHRVFSELTRIISVRSSLPSLNGATESEIAEPINPGVLVFLRRTATQTMVGIYNIPRSPGPSALVVPLAAGRGTPSATERR